MLNIIQLRIVIIILFLDGNYNIKNLPVVFFEQLFPKYNFRKIQCKEDFCYDNGVFNLFAPAFFNGRNNVEPIRNDNTYCSHLFAGSWSHKNSKKERFFCLFPRTLLNALLGLNYHFLRKNKVHYYDPIFRQQFIWSSI